MISFEEGFLKRQSIPHSLLRTVRLIGEYNGKEELCKQQTPQVLEALRQVNFGDQDPVRGVRAQLTKDKRPRRRKGTIGVVICRYH
jgi:hypothetical protein